MLTKLKALLKVQALDNYYWCLGIDTRFYII